MQYQCRLDFTHPDERILHEKSFSPKKTTTPSPHALATILDQGGDGKVLEEVPNIEKTGEVEYRVEVHKHNQPPREKFQSPFSRWKVTQATLSFAVNSSMANKVITTLTSMGIVNARIEVAKWSDKRFYTLANFVEACEANNLIKAWDEDQINAFLDVLHQKFYSASTLDSQWNAFKKVGHLINRNPTPEQELEFGLNKTRHTRAWR